MRLLRVDRGAGDVASRRQVRDFRLTRLDIWVSLVIGLASAMLLQFLVRWWGLPPLVVRSAPAAFVAAPAGALAGIYFVVRLSRYWPSLEAVSKFALVGVFNTLIDLTVLNLLLSAAGVTRGPLFVLFKILSFSVAVANGFFWHKNWSFAPSAHLNKSEPPRGAQFTLFTTLTVVGIGLNAGAAAFLVHAVQPGPLLSPLQWANVAAAVAVVVSAGWNFYAYRFLVFPARSR